MEKSSFKSLCVLCFSLLCLSVKAQILEDVTGRPIMELEYTDVQGSPYLTDLWTKGLVKLANGKTYKEMELKYDQVTDELIFKNADGQILSFLEPVLEFKLMVLENQDAKSLNFRNGFKPVEGTTVKTFYQVLSDGETPLIKRIFKKVIENKPFNSATTNKTFQEIKGYYLVKNNLPVKIKRDKKSVFYLLGDYNAELETFMKENKLNLKADDDLIKLMAYYNSLK